MNIWRGNTTDTTNFVANTFLQVNSCGFQHSIPDYTVIRENGRYDYHILLLNSGTCEVLHNDKFYTLTKGNLIMYAPCEEQKYVFKTDSTSLWCHFSGRIVQEVLNSCHMTSGVYYITPDKTILETFSTLIQRFHHPGKERFSTASLLELIYSISDATKNPLQSDKSAAILPALTHININYNKQITLDELAMISGYSKSRFSHLFLEITGTTPIKYQNNIRLKLSCEMLTATTHSITDIALSCGFSDPLYFSRIFKKEYNVTPTEYRLSTSTTAKEI